MTNSDTRPNELGCVAHDFYQQVGDKAINTYLNLSNRYSG